ncbi:MAG: family 10 glycosylhydrolase [Pirellulales bacterium]|nr:family 10 glycosylhydrolase [Pirellulales bacterium]
MLLLLFVGPMMVGQGSPKTSRAGLVRPGRDWLGSAWRGAPIFLALLLVSTAKADESIRVRVAWGGPTARLWQGTITLDEGTLDELRPLGIEADEPGSMWLNGRTIVIRGRSPRLYDGFDVLIHAPSVDRAKLHLKLTADGDPTAPRIEIPLVDTLDNPVSADLDQKGTRLLVRRSPGDSLRVEFDRRNLIFSPGETFSLVVHPNLLPSGSGGQRQLKVELRAARGDQARNDQIAWKQEASVQKSLPLSVPLPLKEGVYDLVVSVIEAPSFHLRSVGSVPLGLKKKVLAERKVQLLVLGPRPPEEPTEAETLRTVEQIDPANPKWWERFAKPPPSLAKLRLGNLPRFWQGPLGSGDMQSQDHPLGKLARLGPSRSAEDVSWEAYTLPIKRPNQPHVLEVEYPSDMPQQLGISVLEPNSAGALAPIQLDSGVNLADEIVTVAGQSPKMLHHRLIFWPHTEAPLVLITNQSSNRPAVYGKIRVSDGWTRLPPKAIGEAEPRRLLAAYFDRPLFPESFCATEAYDDDWSRQSLDDWLTFYEGGTRLVEYLRHVGMNGMMISVLAEGATIYPSQIVQPTPRYDRGPFFGSGQDPRRKDVLEMLFRLFDRQQMRLIPAMEFAAPLPELEAFLRAGGPESEGMRWVGSEGLTWEQVYEPHRRMAPYYNLLHPRVQAAVLRAVREVVDNYAHAHPSFGGVAIQLSAYGYGQLPGADWGMDDVTVARFERETGSRVPADPGPQRFAQRHAFLTGQGRHAWLSWRAACLGRFYRHLQSEILAVRGDVRLYLTTGNSFAGPYWEERLRPTLSQPVTMDEVLLEAGIDTTEFGKPGAPILVRSRHLAPLDSPGSEVVELALQQPFSLPDHEACLGSLFFHGPRELRLESFDRKSPYRKSYAMLSSQLVPSSYQNRRRFVRELASCDSHAIFDGGRLLPMGQEESLADLIAAYRRLPAIPMKRVAEPSPPQSSQPVTIRYGSQSGKTYVYAVNDSPVPVSLSVQVAASPDCRLEPLIDTRKVPPLTRSGGKTSWRVDMASYDLVAAKLTDPAATFSTPQVSLPGGMRDSLWMHIRDLGERWAALRSPPRLSSLSNAGFEKPANSDGTIPGWIVQKSNDTKVQLRRDPKRSDGSQVVQLSNSSANAALMSEPFSPPSTGRLSMSVWLRVPDQRDQPSLELVFQGRLHGEPFSRIGVLGRAVDGPSLNPIDENWKEYLFDRVPLPLEGLSDLQVGLRLVGPGEVWVDDVVLKHLEFSPDECRQLSRVISLAEMKLQTNQVGDCMRLLEGFWPRFLERNVPLPTNVARRAPPAKSPEKPPEKPAVSTTLLDRVRGLVPRKLW